MSESKAETLDPNAKMEWEAPTLQRLDVECAENSIGINVDGFDISS
ncbi:MAG: hypothetical protein V7672_14155 [Brevundimonas sp.]